MTSSICTLGFYTSQGMLASDASVFGSLIGSLDNPLVYTVNNWLVSTIIDSRVVLYRDGERCLQEDLPYTRGCICLCYKTARIFVAIMTEDTGWNML